jgi:hypothetical protein
VLPHVPNRLFYSIISVPLYNFSYFIFFLILTFWSIFTSTSHRSPSATSTQRSCRATPAPFPNSYEISRVYSSPSSVWGCVPKTPFKMLSRLYLSASPQSFAPYYPSHNTAVEPEAPCTQLGVGVPVNFRDTKYLKSYIFAV